MTRGAVPSLCGILTLCAANALGQQFIRQQSDSGLSVELSVRSATPRLNLQEEDEVSVEISVTDESGNPMPGLNPLAWMSLRAADGKTDEERCTAKVATFTAGNLFVRPEVDLNVYHVLAMNADGTISVVDPRFGYGGTQLLALVDLPGPAEDWSLNAEGKLLFVSIPQANQVAVVDTGSWKILRSFSLPHPTRVVLQPDGRYVWVAGATGVSILEGDGSGKAAHIATPLPPRDIILTEDSRFAIITTGGRSSLVIAVSSLTKTGVLQTEAIVSADHSPLSKLVYLGTNSGFVYAVRPATRAVTAKIKVMAGATQVRIAPGGRFGFVLNPGRGAVEIFDTSTNRVIQQAKVDSKPDRIFFSQQLAYVRHLDSAIVLMIPLAEIGTPGAAVPVIDFPAGQKSFREGATFGLADGIVPAPGENAVLVAHPADRAIYYYKEGMAAPMGHFTNYSRQPRAVMVLDRSLRERRTGVFQTQTRLGAAGWYDVAVFVDSPRIVTCFEMAVEESPALREAQARAVEVQHLTQNQNAKAGQTVRIAFRVVDKLTGQPKAQLSDVEVLVMSVGTWHARHSAVPREGGIYEVNFTPPAAGLYYVYVSAASAGLPLSNPQYLVLRVSG